MDRIEIYTSKKKSVLLLFGALLFVVLGVWLFLNAENLTGWAGRNPLIPKGVGLAAVVFFGGCAVVATKRVLKTELAYIIDPTGLRFYPTRSNPLVLTWKDILGFEEVSIQGQQFFIIQVADPNFWVEQETRFFRRKMMQFNVSNYGSPFNTAAAGLDISHEELSRTLNSYLEKYGHGTPERV
ncbi:STM3941 family protein [Rufibacter hautae]|uniref:Uncharacterized protein n=1 Tax=Rufibacter hautae TaxID=2595005 RepID=A0A5B6TL67_9BACT|nr:STM3941 family protein [Rufibacter hautae]KAA3440746.1 hypothetical protein FOA19_08900 [Rufibacter hautae]